MAAALEAAGHEVLYYENLDGGHAGAADNAQAARAVALRFEFLHQALKVGGRDPSTATATVTAGYWRFQRDNYRTLSLGYGPCQIAVLLPDLLSPQCFPRDGWGRRRAGCLNRHFTDHDFMTGLIQTESGVPRVFRGTSVVGEDVDDHGVFAPGSGDRIERTGRVGNCGPGART